MLRQLARDRNVQARKAAARHRGASVALLRRLGCQTETSPEVRDEVASHPKAAGGLLALLAQSAATRSAALRNPNCPTRILAVVALRGAATDRMSVAINPSLPAGAFMRLCIDPDPYVRIGLAANRGATPQALTRLAGGSEPRVRANVARNMNCPSETLACLCSDPDESTRIAAQATQARQRKAAGRPGAAPWARRELNPAAETHQHPRTSIGANG